MLTKAVDRKTLLRHMANVNAKKAEKLVMLVSMLTVVDSSYEICTTGGAARYGLYNSKGELMYKLLLGAAMLMWGCSCWLCFRIGRWLSMQPKQQHSERKKKQTMQKQTQSETSFLATRHWKQPRFNILTDKEHGCWEW